MTIIHILDHLTDKIVQTLENKQNSQPFWNDNHTSNLKNEEHFDFQTLYDNSQHLTSRNRVIIPDEDGFFREFIVDETIKDKETKEVYTTASYLDLRKQKVIEPTTLEGATVNTSTDFILSGTEWKRGITEYAGIRSITFENYTDPFKALKQIASMFELELRFRIEVQGGSVVGRYVDLIKRQGEWRGKEVEVGKDLIGLKRREQAENIVSALLCLGPEREDGTQLVLTVEDEEARQRWSRTGQHMWDIYEPQSEDQDMTEERLRSLGETELNKRINSVVQYEADQASIEHIFGYEHEKVRLGDTTRIKDTSYAPALYMEARVISVERSISDPSQKKYILGDFIEYDEEDLKANFRALQKIVAQKVSEQKLLDTTYTKVQIDDKDVGVYQDGTIYTDQRSDQAETNAKDHAEQKDEEVKQEAKSHADDKAREAEDNAKGYALTEAEKARLAAIQAAEQDAQNKVNEARTALEADISAKADKLYVDAEIALKVAQDIYDAKVAELEGSIDSKVAETTFNTTITNINADIAEKAGLEYVDGQLVDKANKGDVYTKIEVNNALDSKVSTTTYNTDMDGVVTRLNNAETSISSNESEIALKASQTDLDTIKGRLSTAETSITANANEIALKASQTEVNEIEGRVSTTESTLSVHANEIASKVSQVDHDSLTGRVSTAETNITQNANEIATKASQTDVDALGTRMTNAETTITQNSNDITLKATQSDLDTVEGRVTDAEAEIVINANEISQRVAKTTYDTKMSELDNSISNHATRLSTAETSITQNANAIESRATKTEVNNLTGRVSTAETTLTQHSTEISSKASQTALNTLTGRVSTAESNITQNANEISQRVTKTEFDDLTIGGRNFAYGEILRGFNLGNGLSSNNAYRNFDVLTLKQGIYIISHQTDLGVRLSPSTNINVLDGAGTYNFTNPFRVEVTEEVNIRVNMRNAETSDLGDDYLTLKEIGFKLEKGNKATDWTPAPEDIDSEINSLTGRLSSAETSITQNATDITSKANRVDVYTKGEANTLLNGKANQNDLTNLTTRVTSAETSITQNAESITSKASQTDLNTLTGRVNTAESNITQNATAITQRVTTTTYESGMAGKENTVFKQNSAPAHLNGRLWLNTSVTPNILYRSTGSAWVKATPTTASEVGAYSSSDGSNLATRVSTAESTITQHADEIALRVEKDGVIGAINLTSETARIAANKIHIDGNVTFSSGYNPKTANDTIDGNKSTWDRASNINSNGTFNTSKLSGTVAENQINSTSTAKWNTANADTSRWKMLGKTTINGGQIETDTITAVQISVTSLDAISANLGTVTAGTIQGVEIIGGSISSNTNINVTTDLYVGDNIYIGNSAQLGTKRLMFNEDSYFQAIDNDVFINALNGKLDIAANGRMNLLAANDTFELYTKQAVLQTTDDFVRVRRGSRPTTIYEVLGRSDTTEIYWNADQNNDYGMIYRVGGTIAARMYRTGAMDIEGDLTVKGTRAIVNQLGFSSGTISGTRNGDIWYGNGFAGVGWYFRKASGWVREIAG
ncbi:phage tail spike protein [Alkalihalobacterium alkalinitrilicum]|uniref:phage tail spike protein n=1 Tax=Alkalihalobacterium alkalinitrilicum TaxID=427920 RepID=UPI000994C0AA|nr:phage tail spike protein [Alkalihalobacterium alkalinitrilicum]